MSEAHPDPVELAALGEDLLDPAESAAVREHLADCPSCTAILADLETLGTELPLLDPPEPMPERVVRRIDAALAAERDAVSRETAPPAALSQDAAPLTATTGGGSTSADDARPPTATPSPALRPPRRRHYLLAAVGAVIALGAGGLVAQSLGAGEDGPEVVAGAAESRAADEPEMFSEQIDSEALETEVQELLTTPSDGAGDERAESAEPSARPPEADTGRDVPPSAGPSTEAPAEDLTTQGGVPGTEEQAEAFGESSPAHSTAPECVLAATGRQDQPLAVADHYAYEGVDSYVLVLPDRQDEESVDVFVVDAACAVEQPTEAGVVLHADTYPRT
ncbi:anti-sigma factor family protein [Streptomyces bohaiensis]|uniref:anti-sigma factor family protein n=1 Tax=Streptomyces bohaiensis TaxID=1431344 RepID=UPI003B7AE296